MSESPIELRGRGGGVVFQGTQSPGGGSQPVACLVYANDVLNIDDFGTPHYLVWDTLYDDVVDGNEIDDFPTGMGLSGKGTDTLTTTEAGVWAFSLASLLVPSDATWAGQLWFGNLGGYPSKQTIRPKAADTAQAFMASLTMNLPAGAGFSVGFDTETPATVSPLNVSGVSVAIVRLA